MPFGPPVLEFLAGWRRMLVWDVDDSIWESYLSPTAGYVPRWVRATGNKYVRLARRADEVWAGSQTLADWCRKHSKKVQIMPTVVEVPIDRPVSTAERTVSWIGSHSTGIFMESVLPAILAVVPPPEVIVVGARPRVPLGAAVDVRPWTIEEERRTLAGTRVGLYPVDRGHPLAEGKCGLKAILYMAHGIPCVLTPTTPNRAVVNDGEEGWYASTHEEWRDRVGMLLDDADMWERMSTAAHARALEDFSVARWGPVVASRLALLADAGR